MYRYTNMRTMSLLNDVPHMTSGVEIGMFPLVLVSIESPTPLP